MDEAIKNLPSYSNIKKCSTNEVTDAIVIIQPIVYYAPQTTALYGDFKIKIYQTRADVETSPDNFIKDMKISAFRVIQFDKATIHENINIIYTKLLEELIEELDEVNIDSNRPTNGSYCDLLNTLIETNATTSY